MALPYPQSTPPPPTPLYPDLMDDQEEEPTYGPTRAEGDTGDPKPRKAQTISGAESEKEAHGLRIAQVHEMAEWLNHSRVGTFEVDEQKIRDGVVETPPVVTMRADLEYINGVISAMDLYLALASRDVTETSEALLIEDAVMYLRDCAIRQHARATGSLLRWSEVNHFQRFGMLVGLDTINPDDHYCGLDMSLIDPMTVFPVWGGRGGLVTVYRVYEDTATNIIGNYGGAPGSKEYRRIKSVVTKIAGKDATGELNRDNLSTVIECWNRDWCQVLVDEKEILNRRFGYGEVPFTIVLGGFDEPPGCAGWSNKDPYQLNSVWGQLSISDRARDIARQAQPFPWRKIKAHALREAVVGRYVTAFRDADNPTWIHEIDPMTKHLAEGEISSAPGHVIEVILGNKLSTLVKTPGAEIVQPLEAILQINAEQGPWSQINAGGIPAQTSDSAIGTMLELGGAAQGVLVSGLELFHQLRGETQLRRWRDWGPALGKPEQRGILSVPSQRDAYGSTPVHELTPEMLERTGCQLIAQLFHWRPNPGMLQYVSGLRQPGGASGAPLISDETARRRLKVVTDPDREQYRIENEMIDSLPAIATQRALRRIDEEISSEIDAGDFEDADRLMVTSIELEFERQKQLMTGGAAPPQPGMAPPGMEGGMMDAPDPQIPSSPPDAQGMSPVAMGDGVGAQGGRPQSTQAPQATQAARPATAPSR